jgi:uncharacterized protein YjiS (DUF1127 family)
MSGHCTVPAAALTQMRDARQADGWTSWLARALRAIETRRQLAAMDDRMLADIGISRTDALREADRRPWDFSESRW